MDIDTFILSVYTRSPIWDKRNKLHSNRYVIDTLWKEISKDMQQEETVLRKKWKYLREKFSGEYSKHPPSRSGDAADNCPPSKWPYFQQLMFLRDIVQARPSSGPTKPSFGSATVPPDDTGPAEDVNFDDAASHCSQDSLLTNQSEEVMRSPQEIKQNVTENKIQFSKETGPSYRTPVGSKRKKKKNQEDYYQRMCNIEERKLQYLLGKVAQKKTETCRENEDLMFLKTLLPHIRKIPEHMKLRFQSRIQNVVEEFAYGPHPEPPSAKLARPSS